MWMVDGKRSHLNYFLNANNLWTKFHQTAEYVYNEFVVNPYCGGGGGAAVAHQPAGRSLAPYVELVCECTAVRRNFDYLLLF